MASSRNGSKTGGLRYLWIPGRKRSHPKGRFDSTSKRITYNTRQKRSEPWSLGGSKGQKDLLKADVDGVDSSPSISGLVPISCAAGVPTIAVASANMPVLSENKFALLDNCELPSTPKDGVDKETSNNHVSTSDLINNTASNHNLKKIDDDLDDLPTPPCCDVHNSDATSDASSPNKKQLSTNSKRSSSTNRPEVDINSIESVSECKFKYSVTDIPDGIHNISHINDINKKKNKKKKKNKQHSDEEEDDILVNCLYYTLMCCDCTIS